jgi:hypothetical protein
MFLSLSVAVQNLVAKHTDEMDIKCKELVAAREHALSKGKKEGNKEDDSDDKLGDLSSPQSVASWSSWDVYCPYWIH